MAGEFITMKVTPGKLSGLHKAMTWLIAHADIETAHDDLLVHHAMEFEAAFKKAMSKKQKAYSLKFTELQALAFCQMWDTNWKHLPMYEQSVVFETNGFIDKERKQIIIQNLSTNESNN